jgi:mono/diheme cytochrome c family protein
MTSKLADVSLAIREDIMKAICGMVLGLFVIGCTAQQSVPTESLVNDGREIAEAQCAGCHAVGSYGESRNADAPPFRTILSTYRSDVLEEELIAGIRVAHPMPEFHFNPQSTDALVAYLQSIQRPEGEGARQ